MSVNVEHTADEIVQFVQQHFPNTGRRRSLPTLPIDWVDRGPKVTNSIREAYQMCHDSFVAGSVHPNQYKFIIIAGPSGDG